MFDLQDFFGWLFLMVFLLFNFFGQSGGDFLKRDWCSWNNNQTKMCYGKKLWIWKLSTFPSLSLPTSPLPPKKTGKKCQDCYHDITVSRIIHNESKDEWILNTIPTNCKYVRIFIFIFSSTEPVAVKQK